MSPARALLDALIVFYEGSGRFGDAGAASVLDRVLPVLRQSKPAIVGPCVMPVTGFLLPALAQLEGPLPDALREASPYFRWRQNPNYTAADMGADFMAGYGYVEFAGPKEALFHVHDVRAGLLVLGPGRHYPLHAHPAEEVYHPLTSGGDWRRGDEDWRRVTARAAIHHPPMVAHETRASGQTLLALYCWAGDTATEARLSD